MVLYRKTKCGRIDPSHNYALLNLSILKKCKLFYFSDNHASFLNLFLRTKNWACQFFPLSRPFQYIYTMFTFKKWKCGLQHKHAPFLIYDK